jgi:quercetin dioxygenase-like cupin family protein
MNQPLNQITDEGQAVLEGQTPIVSAPGLQVSELVLGRGQCVPWHYHNHITDRFFCMEGPMQVLTRNPQATHILQAGETCTVRAGTGHYVSGIDDRACKFMIVQGVGEYDFVPLDTDSGEGGET